MCARVLLKLLLLTVAGGVLFQNPTCTRPDIGRVLQQAVFVDAVFDLSSGGGGQTVFVPP